jgi:hypothetical protein
LDKFSESRIIELEQDIKETIYNGYKGLIQNANIYKNNLNYAEFQIGDLNINLSENGAKKK